MSTIRISLLGRLEIQTPNQCLHTLGVGKADELLCYLLLNPTRPVWREKLASALWKTSSESQAKAYLRRALWQLRTALAEICGASESMPPPAASRGNDPLERLGLVIESDWIQMEARPCLWVDVHVFTDAARQVGPGAAQRRARPPEVVRCLEAAVDLYHGHLLESFYQDWCIYEREHLRLLHLLMLDALVAHHDACGHFARARLYAERTLRHDHTREQTYRRLMEICLRAGDRGEALRTYDRCCAMLDQEFGVEPSPVTRELYDRIRTERSFSPSSSPSSSPPLSSPSTTSLANDLRRLATLLTDASRRLDAVAGSSTGSAEHDAASSTPDAPSTHDPSSTNGNSAREEETAEA
jgi:DNA-binding SARP family transcriptional activator